MCQVLGAKGSISAQEGLTVPDRETSNRSDKAGGKYHHQGRRLAEGAACLSLHPGGRVGESQGRRAASRAEHVQKSEGDRRLEEAWEGWSSERRTGDMRPEETPEVRSGRAFSAKLRSLSSIEGTGRVPGRT